MQYCVVQYSIVRYNIVQCKAEKCVQYSTVQYSAVHYNSAVQDCVQSETLEGTGHSLGTSHHILFDKTDASNKQQPVNIKRT